ncbi:MAG TPA: MBL fold metallo-hydrolase [Chloroflexota bacterium]|nr:MBL fold metallo-hydrolase [Chloroflexota bacterium]
MAAFILSDGEDLGLVETGPASTLPALLNNLEPFGGLDGLQNIVVTHVHLDHAGAVGEILRRAPHVRCYVHRLGAPHVVDPSRLLRSATRIYGDQMIPLWGEVMSAPAAQVSAVDDGDVLRIGGTELRVIYTPGHASHHIALLDQEHGTVFTGDVAGVRLQGSDHIRPPTPPPDIDLVLWQSSVARLRTLRPESLLLTHFGAHSENISQHFDLLLARLERWIELVEVARAAGEDCDAMIESLRREADRELIAEGADATELRRYELATPYGMSVDGILRYLDVGRAAATA